MSDDRSNDAPAWPDKDDAPPLAPRAAERSARTFLRHMSCTDPDRWDAVQIALRRVEGRGQPWVYVVTMRAPLSVPKGSVAGSALAPLVDVPVLFNGTVPVPSVGSHRK